METPSAWLSEIVGVHLGQIRSAIDIGSNFLTKKPPPLNSNFIGTRQLCESTTLPMLIMPSTTITNQRIKVAEILNLNDPFELQAPDMPNRDERISIPALETRIPAKKYRHNLFLSIIWKNPVRCGVITPTNTKCICLGFDVPSSHLTEVRLPKKTSSNDTSRKMGTSALHKLLYVKAAAWGYEEEHRILTRVSAGRGGIEELFFEPFSNDLQLREVIAGPSLQNVAFQSLVSALSGYSDIAVIKSRLSVLARISML